MAANRWVILLVVMTTACAVATSETTTTVSRASTSSVTVPTSTTTSVGHTSSTTAPTTTSSTMTRAPLAGRTVVIDPGHNGMNWAHPEEINRLVDVGNGTKACNTTGTTTDDGYAEPEFTWDVAQLVVHRLEAEGATVVLTRRDNEGWGPCIDERADIGNRSGAHAVVSIHADGGPDDGRGFHVIHPARLVGLTDDIYDESLRLARALHSAYLTTSMPVADYIADEGYSERDDLGGLNLSDVPIVFLEAGNMRNATDADQLADPTFQDQIARAIVDALIDFLGDVSS